MDDLLSPDSSLVCWTGARLLRLRQVASRARDSNQGLSSPVEDHVCSARVCVMTATATILSANNSCDITTYSRVFLESHLSTGLLVGFLRPSNGQLRLLDRQVKGSWVDGWMDMEKYKISSP